MEHWLELTITLPYAVALHEIQIRPHAAQLNTAPSAVQVQLGADTNSSQLQLLSAPLSTLGCNKVRISTEAHKTPVQVVKLSLKRPIDTATLGLSQIMLLGQAPPHVLQSLSPQFTFVNWSGLLSFTLSQSCSAQLMDHVDWTQLAHTLFNVLTRPNVASAACLSAVRLLTTMAHLLPPVQLLTTLVQHLSKVVVFSAESSALLTQLIVTLCTHKHTVHEQCTDVLVSYSRELLLECFGEQCSVQHQSPSNQSLCTLTFTLTAALVWKALLAQQTLKLLFDQTVLSALTDWLGSRCSADSPLLQPIGWLLCSYIAAGHTHLLDVLVQLQNTVPVPALQLLTRAAQSRSAVLHLLQSGALATLAQRLAQLCTQLDALSEKESAELLGLVEMFGAWVQLQAVADWLQQQNEQQRSTAFVGPLVRRLTGAPSHSVLNHTRLYSSTVQLLRALLPNAPAHQHMFCTNVVELLQENEQCVEQSAGSDSALVGLSATVQQLILDTIIEDEHCAVIVHSSTETVNGKLSLFKPVGHELDTLHPSFVCGAVLGHSLYVARADLYSTVSDLVPVETSTKTTTCSAAPSSLPMQMIKNYAAAKSQGYDLSASEAQSYSAKMQLLAAMHAGLPSSSTTTTTVTSTVTNTAVAQEYSVGDKVLASDTALWQALQHSQSDMHSEHGLRLLTLHRHTGTDSTQRVATDTDQHTDCTSTLHVFARMGGLAHLAKYLHVHSPSRMTTNKRKNTASQSQSAVQQTAYDHSLQMAMAANSLTPFDHEYDFDYMDFAAAPSNMLNTFSSTLQTQSKQSAGAASGLSRAMLPAHVVLSFSVFVRVPGYAHLLVTQNRQRAQRLLRLALGVTTDLLLPTGHINNGSEESVDKSTESILSAFCLQVLQCLYENDLAMSLRLSSIRLGVLDLLLVSLAAFAHQPMPELNEDTAPIVLAVRDTLRKQLVESSAVSKTGTAFGRTQSYDQRALNQQQQQQLHQQQQQQQQYWAKGTGFGTGSTSAHNANTDHVHDTHVTQRQRDEANVAGLLNVIASVLKRSEECTEDVPIELVQAIRQSSVLPVLSSYLRNDSVLDISRHLPVYEAALSVLIAMCQWPELRQLACANEQSASTDSLAHMAATMHSCVCAYLSKLGIQPHSTTAATQSMDEISANQSTLTGMDVPPADKTDTDWLTGAGDTKVNSEKKGSAEDEGLLRLAPLLSRVVQLIEQNKDTDQLHVLDQQPVSGVCDTDVMVSQQYVQLMRSLQYESCQFWRATESAGMQVAYHYESAANAAKQSMSAGVSARTRRLAQEAVALASSLPLNWSSSVFVRAAEERLDVMKVLMTGPADTPYANGCFEFDVWFPADYPQVPMQVNLLTTGAHSVRFNPNLYNDGKVCLSVLNTWHGRPEERWNPQTSSFLQVLVSIQSLILVPDPYFNEPGYERSRNTPAGQANSCDYNANIRQATVRWAMIDQLRRPNSVFADVIHAHFWLKRDEIIADVDKWIEDTQTAVDTHRAGRQTVSYLTMLKRYAITLKEDLRKLTMPSSMLHKPTDADAQASGSK